jgi:hypothetical protein
MTPEQLEEIPGIGEELVGMIQLAVNNYYGQFETGESGAAQPPVPVETPDPGQLAAEVTPAETVEAQTAPEEAGEAAETPAPPETAKTGLHVEPVAGESDTIKESQPEARAEGLEEQSEGDKEV